MIRDRNGDADFTKVQLKANASGSWMNVLTCSSEDADKVKEACLVLVKVSRNLRFKLLDADGGHLEHTGYDGNHQPAWVTK